MEGKLTAQLCQLTTEIVKCGDITTSPRLIPNDLKHIVHLCTGLG